MNADGIPAVHWRPPRLAALAAYARAKLLYSSAKGANMEPGRKGSAMRHTDSLPALMRSQSRSDVSSDLRGQAEEAHVASVEKATMPRRAAVAQRESLSSGCVMGVVDSLALKREAAHVQWYTSVIVAWEVKGPVRKRSWIAVTVWIMCIKYGC